MGEPQFKNITVGQPTKCFHYSVRFLAFLLRQTLYCKYPPFFAFKAVVFHHKVSRNNKTTFSPGICKVIWVEFQVPTYTHQDVPKSKCVATMTSPTHWESFWLETSAFLAFWYLKKKKKEKKIKKIWSFFKSANSNEFAPPICSCVYCVCVFVWMPVLTLTDTPLQWLRWTFNYMGSKSLHYERAERMKGWKSKGE